MCTFTALCTWCKGNVYIAMHLVLKRKQKESNIEIEGEGEVEKAKEKRRGVLKHILIAMLILSGHYLNIHIHHACNPIWGRHGTRNATVYV